MRIIRDILPMKPNQENQTELQQEVLKYDGMTRPFLEHFVTNNVVHCLSYNFHILCVKTYLYFSNIFSDSFLHKWKMNRVLKQIKIKNEKERKTKIKTSVRSYKNNFEKFNFSNTCFEKAGENIQKYSSKEIYSRERHNTIKNRNIERHWKND